MQETAPCASRVYAGRLRSLLRALARCDDLGIVDLLATLEIRGREVSTLDLAGIKDRWIGWHRFVGREIGRVAE